MHVLQQEELYQVSAGTLNACALNACKGVAPWTVITNTEQYYDCLKERINCLVQVTENYYAPLCFFIFALQLINGEVFGAQRAARDVLVI